MRSRSGGAAPPRVRRALPQQRARDAARRGPPRGRRNPPCRQGQPPGARARGRNRAPA
jgi:hypothetical protein